MFTFSCHRDFSTGYRQLKSQTCRGSRLLIFAEFLEAGIIPERVEHGIEPK